MSLSGDLSLLELADLLQNLEAHKRSGTLTVESEEDTAQLYFQDGCLTMFARPERACLMDLLISAGAIRAEDHALACKKRRRTGKSLGEVLVKLGAIEQETLEQIASTRLLDEACELVTAKRGAFHFQAGNVPRGVFDPEERCLNLSLRAGPLVMEAARREDHWQLIRQRVPSDSAHFLSMGTPRGLAPAGQVLAAEVLPLLDGSHSVSEIVATQPHRRFEVYQLLSDLVQGGSIRAVGPDEWLGLIQAARISDGVKAERLLGRALAVNPHHLGLLTEEVALAQDLDQLERAVDALKMVVHLAFEAGDTQRAKEELARGRNLAPDETSFLERSVDLALEEGDYRTAVDDGLQLVALWRKPGLHTKALELLTRLHKVQREDAALLFELSRSRADCGDLAGAVSPLVRLGVGQLARGDELAAKQSFEEVCKLDPKHKAARKHLDAIERGEASEARACRARRWQRLRLALVLALIVASFVHECFARKALMDVESTVARERMIEEGRYGEAAERYAALIDRYPVSITTQWNARRRLSDLALKGGRPAHER